MGAQQPQAPISYSQLHRCSFFYRLPRPISALHRHWPQSRCHPLRWPQFRTVFFLILTFSSYVYISFTRCHLSPGDIEVPAFTAAIEAHQERITRAVLDHALGICSEFNLSVRFPFSSFIFLLQFNLSK